MILTTASFSYKIVGFATILSQFSIGINSYSFIINNIEFGTGIALSRLKSKPGGSNEQEKINGLDGIISDPWFGVRVFG